MGTFAFAANEVENNSTIQNTVMTELLNVSFDNVEVESLNPEGCYSTVFVKSRKTGKILHSFVRWDEDCEPDYQTEVVWL